MASIMRADAPNPNFDVSHSNRVITRISTKTIRAWRIVFWSIAVVFTAGGIVGAVTIYYLYGVDLRLLAMIPIVAIVPLLRRNFAHLRELVIRVAEADLILGGKRNQVISLANINEIVLLRNTRSTHLANREFFGLALVLKVSPKGRTNRTRRAARLMGYARHPIDQLLNTSMLDKEPLAIAGAISDAIRLECGRHIPIRIVGKDGVEPIPARAVQSCVRGETDAQVATADIRCVVCGYDVRLRAWDSRCPECGTRVGESRRGLRLELAPRAWVAQVRWGSIGLMFASLLLAASLSPIALDAVLDRLSPASLRRLHVVIPLMLAGATGAIGVMLFTTSSQIPAYEERDRRIRGAARLAACLGFTANLLMCIPLVPSRVSYSLVLGFLGIGAYICLRYASTLLTRCAQGSRIRAILRLSQFLVGAISITVVFIGFVSLMEFAVRFLPVGLTSHWLPPPRSRVGRSAATPFAARIWAPLILLAPPILAAISFLLFTNVLSAVRRTGPNRA